jgi:hypothetical protein
MCDDDSELSELEGDAGALSDDSALSDAPSDEL